MKTRQKTSNPEIIALLKRTYPDYRGRKFCVETYEDGDGLRLKSYWDGGSRDYFTILDSNGVHMVPSQSAFDTKIDALERFLIVPGVCVAENSCFCGKWTGLTLHVHKEDLSKWATAAFPDGISPAVI